MTDGTEKIPTDIYVLFDLPFPINVTNSVPSDPAAVPPEEVAPPIGVNLEVPVEICTLLRPSGQGSAVAMGRLRGGDVFGRFSYSTLQVRMSCEAFPEVLGWSERQIIDHAVKAANHLIDNYRAVSGIAALPNVVTHHLIHFRLVHEYADGTHRMFHRSIGSGGMAFNTADQAEAEREVRRRLMLGQIPATSAELELSAKRHLAGGHHRLAVIDAASLFEVWVKEQLRARMEAEGLEKGEIEAKFVDGNGRFLGVRTLVKDVLPSYTKGRFTDTAEYRDWDQHTREARNEVIHRGRANVTAEEAHRALQGAISAALKLQELLKEDGGP